MIDTHEAILKELYWNFCSVKVAGDKFGMNVEDFIKMFESANLINEAFNIWNAGYILSQSQEVAIDDIKSLKYIWYIEFVESFAWACEHLSFPSED